ncbi:hypothetical protein niasHT_034928 [Heterodera trifolii]|uniref:Uncharacterized protein n=1 Tax=Heterodera trifolii TaxID=157864 RepID=A0ABD2IAV8_9BILA
MENLSSEMVKQFVDEMNENEQLINAVFTSKKKVRKEIISALKKKLNGADKQKAQLEIDEKYRNLVCITEHDPAMGQILQNLHTLRTIKNGEKILKNYLIQYLRFAIQFLAKRQQISVSEIIPVAEKQIDKKRILAELVKLSMEKKREKKEKRKTKNGQKSSENYEQKVREKERKVRMMRLLMAATENGDGNLDGANLKFAKNKRRRRKKRDTILLVIILIVLFIVSGIINYRHQLIDLASVGCPCFPPLQRWATASAASRNRNNGQEAIAPAVMLWPENSAEEISQAFLALPEQQVHGANEGAENLIECAVCLSEIESGEMTRQLPACETIDETVQNIVEAPDNAINILSMPNVIETSDTENAINDHSMPNIVETSENENAIIEHLMPNVIETSDTENAINDHSMPNIVETSENENAIIEHLMPNVIETSDTENAINDLFDAKYCRNFGK